MPSPSYYSIVRTARIAVAMVLMFFFASVSLGNNRTVVSEGGALEQVTHYYPFGGVYGDAALNSGAQPYKYNGKEFDHTHGLDWLDYGARMYDPALMRWNGVDPLAEDYADVSPYAYCLENPVRLVDPDGQMPVETIWDIANVLYDVGAATVEHIRGNHPIAKEHWRDLGADAMAMFIPYVPAGTTKVAKVAVKATKVATNATKTADKTQKAVKTYQTYTKINPKTGKVYVGRTSGTKSPRKNIEARDHNHHMNKYGYGPARLDKTSKSSDAIRGREQLQIEKYGGAQSVGGTSGNKINGISPKNKNRDRYINATKKEFKDR